MCFTQRLPWFSALLFHDADSVSEGIGPLTAPDWFSPFGSFALDTTAATAQTFCINRNTTGWNYLERSLSSTTSCCTLKLGSPDSSASSVSKPFFWKVHSVWAVAFLGRYMMIHVCINLYPCLNLGRILLTCCILLPLKVKQGSFTARRSRTVTTWQHGITPGLSTCVNAVIYATQAYMQLIATLFFLFLTGIAKLAHQTVSLWYYCTVLIQYLYNSESRSSASSSRRSWKHTLIACVFCKLFTGLGSIYLHAHTRPRVHKAYNPLFTCFAFACPMSMIVLPSCVFP